MPILTIQFLFYLSLNINKSKHVLLWQPCFVTDPLPASRRLLRSLILSFCCGCSKNQQYDCKWYIPLTELTFQGLEETEPLTVPQVPDEELDAIKVKISHLRSEIQREKVKRAQICRYILAEVSSIFSIFEQEFFSIFLPESQQGFESHRPPPKETVRAGVLAAADVSEHAPQALQQERQGDHQLLFCYKCISFTNIKLRFGASPSHYSACKAVVPLMFCLSVFQSYSFLISSDYERAEWKEIIKEQQKKCEFLTNLIKLKHYMLNIVYLSIYSIIEPLCDNHCVKCSVSLSLNCVYLQVLKHRPWLPWSCRC